MFKYFFTLLLILSFSSSTYAKAEISPETKIQQFINDMVAKDKFDKSELEALFKKTKLQKPVIKSMNHPYEAKPWEAYRRIFVTKSRIDGGVKFWHDHEAVLAKAAKVYGVPPEIIVAIIGVETRYGKHQGSHPAFAALATLAFYYPTRQAFFQSELREYLLLTREQHFQVRALKGSYAGALGESQFMPSSYRHYGVDFSGDGIVDLFHSDEDVIGSTANYLKKHGWHRNEKVIADAKVSGEKYAALKQKGAKPKYTLDEWAKVGVTPDAKLPQSMKARLITLKGKEHTYRWLGFNNFYALRTYNPRDVYALAVFDLSEAIKHDYKQKK